MSESARIETFEVTCPHCKKPFEAELMDAAAEHRGFKCPHCRLFVPYERANGDDAPQAS